MRTLGMSVAAIFGLVAALFLYAGIRLWNEPDPVLRRYIEEKSTAKNAALTDIVDQKWDVACFASNWGQYGHHNIREDFPSIFQKIQKDGAERAPYEQTNMLLIDTESSEFEIQRVSDGASKMEVVIAVGVEEFCLPVDRIHVRSANSGARDFVEVYAKDGAVPSG